MPVSWNINVDLSYDFRGGRQPGLHASAVLREMAFKYKVLKAEPEDAMGLSEMFATINPSMWQGNPSIMRAIMGFAWEEWLKKVFGNRPGYNVRPMPLVVDGIICTRDLEHVDQDTGKMILDEVKTTYKSANTPACEVQLWMWQAAVYLKAMTVHYGELCDEAVFHPFHFNGPGRGIDPVYAPQRVRFEEEEIEMVWSQVQRFKHQAKPEV